MDTIYDLLDSKHLEFLEDVLHGLSQQQKSIPSKWFYDEAGSHLFEDITRTREYYPTRVETRLLHQVSEEIGQFTKQLNVLIEPGSGASLKTRILFESSLNIDTYIPVDISEAFLHRNALQLQKDFPRIRTIPLVGDFTKSLPPLGLGAHDKKLLFFPGSTVGNFSPIEARSLLRSFNHLVGQGGWLLIGVDSTQDREQLLAAYNDIQGITAEFNKNLLKRANRELRANFDLERFSHEARYNEDDHLIEMHLVSDCEQTVTLGGKVFGFAAGETIFTESCYKYPTQDFLAMADDSGWRMEHAWMDDLESRFQIFLLRAKPG